MQFGNLSRGQNNGIDFYRFHYIRVELASIYCREEERGKTRVTGIQSRFCVIFHHQYPALFTRDARNTCIAFYLFTNFNRMILFTADRKITWSGYASQFLLYLWGEMMEWSLAIAAKHCGNPNF